MKRVIVQYKVKADRAAENEAYVRKVFEELKQTTPDGIRYATFKQPDGVSFVHIASIETENGDNPLNESPAFMAFQAEIKDRCEEPPVAVDLEEIGSYRLMGS
jgi:predicted lipid-binding transport protein (Tim44 family)